MNIDEMRNARKELDAFDKLADLLLESGFLPEQYKAMLRMLKCSRRISDKISGLISSLRDMEEWAPETLEKMEKAYEYLSLVECGIDAFIKETGLKENTP